MYPVEFFGNQPVVNGVLQPFQAVSKNMYRLRLLNVCQGRFLSLKLELPDGTPAPITWTVIGNEAGLMETPRFVDFGAGQRFLMGPAERADVIVDFTGVATAPGAHTRFIVSVTCSMRQATLAIDSIVTLIPPHTQRPLHLWQPISLTHLCFCSCATTPTRRMPAQRASCLPPPPILAS